MTETILIYNVLFAVCELIACKIDKKSKIDLQMSRKKSVSFDLFLLVLFLSLVSGLRSYNVGIDSNGYANLILVPGQRSGIESGFLLLKDILISINDSYTFSFFVIALVTNFFIIERLNELKEFAPLRYSFPVYFVMLYFSTMSGIRQWLAISIVFFGSKYIFEHKPLRFLICTFIATFIHSSAIVSLLFLLILFGKKSRNANDFLKKSIVFLMIPIGSIYAYSVLIKNYQRYDIGNAITGQVSIGLMMPIKLFVLVLIVILFISDGKGVRDDLNKSNGISRKILLCFELVVVMTSFFGYIETTFSRIGWYCAVYTSILYGYVLSNKWKNYGLSLIVKLLIIVIIGYTYYTMYTSTTNHLVPFEFYWQAI